MPIAMPDTNTVVDTKLRTLEDFFKDIGPTFNQVREDTMVWTQSPMSDAPIWDRVMIYKAIELENRMKRLEKLLEIQPMTERV